MEYFWAIFLAIVLLVTLFTQIVVPAVRRQPLFPAFRWCGVPDIVAKPAVDEVAIPEDSIQTAEVVPTDDKGGWSTSTKR